MSTPQLIVSGSIALDRIMNFSGKYRDLIHPDKLHVLSLSVLLDSLEQTPGGVGANIAYYAARLGDRPILLGSAGPDALDYLKHLTSLGINTESVHLSQLPTASFNVMTDAEDSQVGGFYPGAMGDSATLSLRPWVGQDVFVSISANDPAAMRSLVAECRQYNLRLLYDPGQQVSNVPGEDLRAGLNAAEVLTVNDYELSALCQKTGTTPEQLKIQLPLVITTLGAEGSVIEGRQVKTPVKIAAAKPTKIVDPTGAGDAYRAGFLYGYLRQWDVRACGQLASTLASFIVEQHGTQRELSKNDVISRYQDNFNEEINL